VFELDRPQVTVLDLLESDGRLKPIHSLSPHVAAHVECFDVIRTTLRQHEQNTVTEEVIRIKLRNGSTAVTSPKRRRRGRIIRQVSTL